MHFGTQNYFVKLKKHLLCASYEQGRVLMLGTQRWDGTVPDCPDKVEQRRKWL